MQEPYRTRNLLLADELASGRRKQGKGMLRREKDGEIEECCLGVACDLSLKDVNGRWVPSADGLRVYAFCIVGGTVTGDTVAKPPPEVHEYYGWDPRQPVYLNVDGISDLAILHNDRGKPFSKIAEGFRKLAEAG